MKGDIDDMKFLKDIKIGEEFKRCNKTYIRVELSNNILKTNEIAALEKETYKVIIFQRCDKRFI